MTTVIDNATTGSPAPSRQRLSPKEHRRLALRYRLRTEATAWAFLGPFAVFFVVFLLIPVIQVFWWSTRQGGLTTGSTFIGLQNFQQLPGQVQAVAAIRNTFLFALMSIPVELVLAMVVAFLLARVKRGAAVYRFFVYFPALVPPVVAGLIWIFLTSADFGLFNRVLAWFGIDPQVWLGNSLALPSLAGVDVWMNTGFWGVFFLAAIIGLPRDLAEAADIDGATAWQRLYRVTLPQLRRVILYAVVVATIFGLQVFDTVVVLTQAGPGTSTLTVVYAVWKYIFGATDQVGTAAAISVVLLAGILILTLIQMRVLRGRRGED
jgi:ABC-type sugar transport system permease subunit